MPVAALAVILLLTAGASLPEGYWPESKSNEILAKTQTIRLAPDLSTLTPGEAAALKELLQVGAIFQQLYEDARHRRRSRRTGRWRALTRASATPSPRRTCYRCIG